MSVIFHEIKGYEDYAGISSIYSLSDEPWYCWFMGTRVNGQSWCGDCRDSEPVIKDYLNSLKLKENINVICAEIDREDFKSPNCIFRKAAWVKLEKVPTLFNPSLQRRLVERECMDKDKLDSFFSDVMKV
ncbi:thioredoxin domain-containing protein 17 isoform X1 [Halyomorpha halys]|uniref:thioredoxin domain-containing protein 17 isoform X1 n=1 Tax=Halyomorpha halys TaxID=286706 RepID=UPI0006D4F27C|nr:thioredoxin domain-containing protein 17-like isoform X1 [Halyomorpha halys]